MRDQALAAFCLLSGLLAACGGVQLPYPLETVQARQAPVHPSRVAVLPFVDARGPEEGPDDARGYIYQGIELEHTDLSELKGSPSAAITGVVAQHLARSRVFSQIILVNDKKDAPEADLVLSAEIRRARGYVETEPRKKSLKIEERTRTKGGVSEAPPPGRTPGSSSDAFNGSSSRSSSSSSSSSSSRSSPSSSPSSSSSSSSDSGDAPEPPPEHTVLAEVMLARIELRESRGEERLLLRADVGWTVYDVRRADPNPPDAWTVLAEALHVAVGQLVALIERSRLDGSYVVRDRVSLDVEPMGAAATSTLTPPFGRLPEAPPTGWRFERAAEPGRPVGWRGEAACEEARLVEAQEQHFHRVLGPYRPTVVLWACPPESVLTYDGREEFPAVYMGTRFDGLRYFAHKLGESNWPEAEAEIARHLRVEAPRSRYIFEIGPGR